jgi:hypothetical protein
MPHWPKSKTSEKYLLLIGDLVDSYPDGRVFHVEDVAALLNTKKRFKSGKSFGRLLPREPTIISVGHGVWRVARNV